MRILVSGSLAYDRIMDFPGRFSDYILPDKIHVLNVCFNVNGLVEKFGGTAGNIAYTLNLLKEKPFIIATIGRDYHNYFKWLKKNDIAVDGIKIIENEFTAGAYITTDIADNQITGFNPGAMKYPSHFNIKNNSADNSLAIIAPGNIDDMVTYAKQCRDIGIPFICDPGQSLSKWNEVELKEWLKGSFILITNDYELEIVMKITKLDKEGLLNLTSVIITTHGENGSIILTKDSEINIPPAKVQKVVDPTGAGDAYRAGLIKGIVSGKSIEISAKIGAVAAVFAIEKYGTQEHYFTYEEFTKRYKYNFGEL
ncbi:MAG: carbohydrate kinase family protein [Nitrospirae bacterium]|jgi:adenosine kinase|nr:carbohydrate kinase family protein [Nitrospirota bacterium]